MLRSSSAAENLLRNARNLIFYVLALLTHKTAKVDLSPALVWTCCVSKKTESEWKVNPKNRHSNRQQVRKLSGKCSTFPTEKMMTWTRCRNGEKISVKRLSSAFVAFFFCIQFWNCCALFYVFIWLTHVRLGQFIFYCTDIALLRRRVVVEFKRLCTLGEIWFGEI